MKQVFIIVLAGFLAGSTLGPVIAQETAANSVASAAEPTVGDVVETTEEPTVVEAPQIVPLNAAEVSLADFLWVKRPIVIFADTPADPRFQEQLKLLLERPAELLERDVVLIIDSNPADGSEIRKKLRPRGFMLTLIGKDGGIKLRKPFAWTVREITHAIDKWPLRKEELRAAKAEALE